MDSFAHLESRINSLERSLRRSRMVLAASLLLAFLFVGLGMTRQAQEEVRAARLVLTTPMDSIGVVLQAGPQSSLLVLTSEGEQVVRLGGPPIRPVR